MEVLEKLTSLDFFPKVPEELKVKTTSSAVVTLVVGIAMSYLMISEFFYYTNGVVTSEVGVDVTFNAKLPINFDFEFPGLECPDFGLDFVDLAGDQQLEVTENIQKTPLPVKGCRIHGFLLTSKVQGEFHVAFGRLAVAADNSQSQHIHRFNMREIDQFNASHIINKLSFGDSVPGIANTLDSQKKIVLKNSARFQYYVKVVPTTYVHQNGHVTDTNQYSYTLHEIAVDTHARSFKQPGVFFKYDLAPYRVTYREHRQPFAHFITQLCAILGGLFVVAGLVSSAIFHAKPSSSKPKNNL
jgi:hypothetical protein